jgi:hypothetical protein
VKLRLWACGPVLLIACAHVEKADPQAYAQAISEGRLRDAYGMTAEGYRAKTSFEAYAAAQTPEHRAEQLEALSRVHAGALAAAPELFSGDPDQARLEAARDVLRSFVQAAEARRFSAVWALLGGELRARYTPERLEREFFEQPLAGERVKRAREALAGPARLDHGRASFPIGEGRAVVLEQEPDGFRVVALE